MNKKKFLLFLMITVMSSLFASVAFAADFADIDSRQAVEDIHYVVAQGLFSGASQSEFQPDAPLTKGMAVTVLARQAKITGVVSTVFTDVPADAYYALPAGWAVKNQIVPGGSQPKFEPNQPLTATELQTMLQQYLAWLGRTEAPAFVEAGDQIITRAQSAVAFAALDRFLKDASAQVLTHRAADGVMLTGKLDLPAAGNIDRVILFVNGSGPNTYENHRQTATYAFNYFDVFAQQLTARGAGFFRWNTRGVSLGEQPPLFAEMNDQEYQTYLPATSISDIGEWIKLLRQEPRLQHAKFYLLGWSEGTIIAPLAAKAYPQEISGLLLAGYCNDRMDTIFDWQQSGASSMIFYNQYFDYDGNGVISQAEFEQDTYEIKQYVGVPFATLDGTKDGLLTAADFALMLAPGKAAFYDAVTRGDDGWLRENYGVPLTAAWFLAHQQLAPNCDTLPTLELPIAIFHGTADQNCDVNGVYAIQKSFQEKGKNNLDIHIYAGYNHDLNYQVYPATGVLPPSFEDLFQACVQMR